jgi:hypothetical protein
MMSFLARSATVWNRRRKERAHQSNREKYFMKTVLALHLKNKKGMLLTRGYLMTGTPGYFD